MSLKNINNITYCEVDKTQHRSVAVLVHHLKKLNVNPIDYYNNFIKKDSEGSCPVCDAKTKFISIQYGYNKYCSINCKLNDPILNRQRRQKAIETFNTKYGVDHPSKIDGFVKKLKQTKLERYGDENYVNPDKAKKTNIEKYGENTYTGSNEYNNKRKNTCLERYGVEHSSMSDVVKTKKIKNCLEKYGVEHTLQLPEVRKTIKDTVDEKYGGFTLESPTLKHKVKTTMVERYGVESPLQSSKIKNKQQTTNLELYGGITPTKHKDVIQKIKDTNLNRYGVENTFNLIQTKNTFMEKYGVTNPSQIPEVKEKVKQTCVEKYGNNTFFGSEYAINKIKETCLRKYGVENIMQNETEYRRIVGLLQTAYKIKTYNTKFGYNLYYQSIPELQFIKLCELNNIEIHNGPRIPYIIGTHKKTYYSDFLILENNNKRIVEIKRKHGWWKRDLLNGTAKAKAKAAIKYSKEHGYLPYKILFETKI